MLTSHPQQMRHAHGTAQRLGTSWSPLLGLLLALSGGSSRVCAEEGSAAPATPEHDAHSPTASSDAAASHGAEPGHGAAAEAPADVAHDGAHGAHSGAGHAFHGNHAALFLGATVGTEGLFPSLGVEYERRLPSQGGMFGVTAFGEFTAATTPFLILGAGVVLHPFGQLRLMAMAGAEIALGAEETTEEVTHRVQVQAEGGGAAAPLARVGAAYDFHLGKIAISPSIFVDYAHEHFTPVGGLGIGMGF